MLASPSTNTSSNMNEVKNNQKLHHPSSDLSSTDDNDGPGGSSQGRIIICFKLISRKFILWIDYYYET